VCLGYSEPVSAALGQKTMVNRDRPSNQVLCHVKGGMTVIIILAACLVGCGQSPPKPSAVKSFMGAVARHMEEHAEFGYSEAEIYLTLLSNMPDEAVYEFGDRTCETLRHGGSRQQIVDPFKDVEISLLFPLHCVCVRRVPA
jgi:hypothetical protein